MDKLKALALVVWNGHRKKVLTFIISLILAGAALITGIPLQEFKDAAKDAGSQPAIVAPATLPEPGK